MSAPFLDITLIPETRFNARLILTLAWANYGFSARRKGRTLWVAGHESERGFYCWRKSLDEEQRSGHSFCCEKIIVSDDLTGYEDCKFDRCTLILKADIISFIGCLFKDCVIERETPWPDHWVFAHCKFWGCLMRPEVNIVSERVQTLPFIDSWWGGAPRGVGLTVT